MTQRLGRPPRIAFLLLGGLDHFTPDLIAALAASGAVEVRGFRLRQGEDALAEAMAWTDDPARDAIWFEFCWPPFQKFLAVTDFGGRRVIMRVHRVEAYGSSHAANTPWHKVDDVIVVGQDMERRLLAAAPALPRTTRLHVIPNGVDLRRYRPATAPDPFRIGWCGYLTMHKNPNLALEILYRLRAEDSRYTLHVATRRADVVLLDSFAHLAERMGLSRFIDIQWEVPQEAMPDWHARNGVLLSTSIYESFGYAIAEAAAVGCDVAMLDHTAAADHWPSAMRFGTVDEAVWIIRNASPHRWRGQVARHFSLERQAQAVMDLLRSPRSQSMIPIAHGGWRGRFVLRDAEEHIQRGIAGSGRFYEHEMLEDLRRRLPPDGVFFDVGANIGNHTLFAAGVCGARVLAFEPSGELADHCAANLQANGVAERVELRREGVGERSGWARIVPGPRHNAGMTRLELAEGPEGDAVAVTSLDDAAASFGAAPSVVKVDVEGMEYAVLLGARETLGRHRPALYVEVAEDEAYPRVAGLLRPLGYSVAGRFNATPTYLFLPAAA